MMSLRAPTDDAIARFLRTQRDAPLSYTEVGATAGELPAGYRIDRRREVVGRGDEAFARARAMLDTWRMHEGAGVRVVPAEPVAVGLTVALVVRAAGLYATSACRVVYRLDEPARAGFAYGTLRDHPVVGEERFAVELGANGDVAIELLAFSRPSSLLFRLAAPVTKRTQLAIGAAYIEAVRREIA